MPTPTPQQKWLLQFSSADGAPWGTATYIAKRKASNQNPWHTGCKVTTLVGGYTAMCAIRDALENAIAAARRSSLPAGQRGRVYMCDWRLNAFRDLSNGNAWKTGPWAANQVATDEQTAIGLILRLMEAGIQVRILLWLPPATAGVGAWHLEDHFYVARMVRAQNEHLLTKLGVSMEPLGVVALDRRLASWVTATHHQKMVVIRAPGLDMAFCGGVDLAYTRRDAPGPNSPVESPNSDFPRFFDGDWQSANGVPNPAGRWPSLQSAGQVDYFARDHVDPPTSRGNDLFSPVYGTDRQIWHDQHLQLEGEIVTALEWQFKERWEDPGTASEISATPDFGENLAHITWGSVIFSTSAAFVTNKDDGVEDPTPSSVPVGVGDPAPVMPSSLLAPNAASIKKGMLAIRALPEPAPVATATPGPSTVQMWRTIPYRAGRIKAYKEQAAGGQGAPSNRLYGGEFTIAAGIANAVGAAKNLIWIFDQYFWSLPLARLLNARLQTAASLRVIIVLPPHADSDMDRVYLAQHRARWRALWTLTAGVKNRVAVYDLWDFRCTPGRGIYCHAKTHTYDGSLLVCGSANLNRRSLTGDSELACAVVDKSVVLSHQKKLWSLLFPTKSWPGTDDLDGDGAGAAFFTAFNDAYRATKKTSATFLTEDLWALHKFALPNNVTRDDAVDTAFPITYDELLESESVDHVKLEVKDPDLADIVKRLGAISWRRPPRKGRTHAPADPAGGTDTPSDDGGTEQSSEAGGERDFIELKVAGVEANEENVVWEAKGLKAKDFKYFTVKPEITVSVVGGGIEFDPKEKRDTAEYLKEIGEKTPDLVSLLDQKLHNFFLSGILDGDVLLHEEGEPDDASGKGDAVIEVEVKPFEFTNDPAKGREAKMGVSLKDKAHPSLPELKAEFILFEYDAQEGKWEPPSVKTGLEQEIPLIDDVPLTHGAIWKTPKFKFFAGFDIQPRWARIFVRAVEPILEEVGTAGLVELGAAGAFLIVHFWAVAEELEETAALESLPAAVSPMHEQLVSVTLDAFANNPRPTDATLGKFYDRVVECSNKLKAQVLQQHPDLSDNDYYSAVRSQIAEDRDKVIQTGNLALKNDPNDAHPGHLDDLARQLVFVAFVRKQLESHSTPWTRATATSNSVLENAWERLFAEPPFGKQPYDPKWRGIAGRYMHDTAVYDAVVKQLKDGGDLTGDLGIRAPGAT